MFKTCPLVAAALLGLAWLATSATAPASQMSRMLTQDLPIPSDWVREVSN